MEVRTRTKWGASSLVAAPIVVLAAFATHPHVGTMAGEEGLSDAIAAEIAASSGTWIFSHLLLAVGSGLLALAFIAMRGYLHEAGEDRYSAVGLPFVVLGSVLFALLPAMEMAPVVAHEAGVDVAAVQTALDETIFVPVLVSGSLMFAIGALGYAIGVHRSGALGTSTGLVVAGALVVAAITRFVPVFFVLFYVQSAALFAALWPVAYTMWRRPRPSRDASGAPAAT